MIKRTFYRESIITGSGIDTPELEKILDTQTTTLSHQTAAGKLTTRVTLNLRNFKRRSSDFNLQSEIEEVNQSPRMTDVRHSICGNALLPMSKLQRCQSPVVNTTSGRSLEQFLNAPGGMRNSSMCSCVPNSMSSLISLRASRKVCFQLQIYKFAISEAATTLKSNSICIFRLF